MKHQIIHLLKADLKLAEIVKTIKLKPLSKKGGYFESLATSIISQQLSVKASSTIIKRFKELYPKRRFPSPKDVLKTKDEKLRSAGVSGQKASYIKDLASKIENKEINLRRLSKLSDEEVIEELVRVKGIGRWTAEMFLIFTLHREDVFSHGDLGLKNAIKKLYGFKKHPSEKTAIKITDSWKPYRSLASRYLWKSLDNE